MSNTPCMPSSLPVLSYRFAKILIAKLHLWKSSRRPADARRCPFVRREPRNRIEADERLPPGSIREQRRETGEWSGKECEANGSASRKLLKGHWRLTRWETCFL